MKLADEIRSLHELHKAGALTDDEFMQIKAELLAGHQGEFDSSSTLAGEINQFRRTKKDRWLGGFCGGLGKATGLASWIWRLVFVLFTLYFGVGLIIYILGCIFVPEEDWNWEFVDE